MKANELRIGNLLEVGGEFQEKKIIKVTGNLISTLEKGGKIKSKPIPITEEWLKRFGFSHSFDELWEAKSAYFPIQFSEGEAVYSSDMYHHTSEPFKYVHQLQNLYFALTGEEL